MTHIWLTGQPVRVIEKDDLPEIIIWGWERHQIVSIGNHWRLDTEWWRGRICRDYFLLRTATGLNVVLYCDRLTDEWYIERVYD